MNHEFWVSVWAKRRYEEVIQIPTEYEIHNDFIKNMDLSEVQSAFLQIRGIFRDVYNDIALYPEEFGMPLNSVEQHRVYSQEWRDSGQAPYRPFILLYNLFACSELSDNGLIVSIEKYKAYKPPPKHLSGIEQKVKYPNFLFNKLVDYGFVFEGLKNNKPSNNDIIISYPDNPNLLYLFKQLADKARNVNRIENFLCCHFRLLQDNMETADYGYGADNMADRVLTDTEKEIVYALDNALTEKGFIPKLYGDIECHGVAYYHSEKDIAAKRPYTYRITTKSMDFENDEKETEKMRLQLRIRKVEKCLPFIETCSDSIKHIFTDHSDEGCSRRLDQTCKHGITYEIEGKNYWRCACCHAPFSIKPKLADIPAYIELINLGER